MANTNWLEVAVKDGETVHTFHHFDTWNEMLTEMDECWDNELYEFHFGGPQVESIFGKQLPDNEKITFVSRIDGQYLLAVEVPQHYGHSLN